MAKMQIAAQLYTVRDLTSKDFGGTVKKVAEIGYKGVELAGYGNLKSPQEVRKAFDDVGVRVCGSHIGLDQLQKDLNKVLDDNDIIGNKVINIPWIGDDWRSAEGYAKLNKELERFAQLAKPRGFAVAYHNHSFEFDKFNGKTGMDIIFGSGDPSLVRSELDLFWVRHGGEDPVAYLNKLGQRVVLAHLKDMSRENKDKFAPVGTGVLDFRAIIDTCNKIGVQWGVVEQDQTYETPPLDALRTSYENLKRMGAV